MARQHYLLLGGLALLACGTDNRDEVYRDTALIPYTTTFTEHYGGDVDHIGLRYGTEAGSVLADCTISHNYDRYGQRHVSHRITIDPEKWAALVETDREQVMLHELGHCALGRDHEDTRYSLMWPTILPTNYYIHNREELVHELFYTH